MFVLMGDFSSHASQSRAAGSRGGPGAAVDYAALKESFAHLAALIERFPQIVVRAQLCCWCLGSCIICANVF